MCISESLESFLYLIKLFNSFEGPLLTMSDTSTTSSTKLNKL